MEFHGIKKYYPRIPLPLYLKAFVTNSRPLTLMLPLVGGYFIIQASLPSLTVPTPNPYVTWLALIALLFVNAGGNNFNSVFDVEIDRINKPYRPLPKGVLSIRAVMVFSLTLFSLALVLGYLVNSAFFLLLCLIILLTALYSCPPVRLKRILWVNNGVQAFIRGFLGLLAAWCVYSSVNLTIAAFASVMFLFILFAQTTKDFGDYKGDLAFGVKTVPVVYGLERSVTLTSRLLPTPFILLAAYITLGVLPLTSGLLVLLMPPAVLLPRLFKVESTKMENSAGWVGFYVMMLLLLLGFMLTV